uniref:DUF6249 domain-containing protein n=1 Tax=uncultured Draconibacterium sp. TaxID=1573823 RepID=UPI0032170D49
MRNFDITLIWLGFFAAVFLAWYFYIKARNKERMALIESGKDVSEIYSKQEIKFRFPWLKLGVIGTGFSFGMLVAFFSVEIALNEMKLDYRIQEEPILFGIVSLFTAISIIVAYFVDKPKK